MDDRTGALARVFSRPWAKGVVYVVGYVVLDRVSYVFPVEPFAITPWNPPAGLSVAFLLLLGTRFAPALFLAALLADMLVRGGGVHPGYSVASSLVITLGYAGLGTFLRSGVRVDPSLRRVRDVAWLVASAVPASLAVAVAYVGLHGAAGHIPRGLLSASILRLWIGDMIGIIVTTPVLLLLATAPPLRLVTAGRRAEIAGQIAATLATLVPVLVLGDAAEPRFFYLLFPPIISLVEPVGHLVVPLFFVYTGSQVNLAVLGDVKVLAVALGVTAIALAGKLVAGLVAGPVDRWVVGWGMAPRGEVGLIFAVVGRQLGVVDETTFSVLVVMVMLTTLLTPPVLAALIRRRHAAPLAERVPAPEPVLHPEPEGQNP